MGKSKAQELPLQSSIPVKKQSARLPDISPVIFDDFVTYDEAIDTKQLWKWKPSMKERIHYVEKKNTSKQAKLPSDNMLLACKQGIQV